MNPAARRKRLFRESRPSIEQVNYQDLYKWVRLATQQQGDNSSDDEFADWLEEKFSDFDNLLFISDKNKGFKSGRGPIGVVGEIFDGPIIYPHVEWFPWADIRNRLRGSVQFFMQFRKKGKGHMEVHCSNDSEKYFKRMKRFCPLFPVGRIPGGDRLSRGDKFIFYIKGRG